jgi:Flp pilus assembly protein TadG
MKTYRRHKTRPGYVAPLVALLLVPLLGMMAFSIDIGYLVEARSELVNATDAAALAGSQQFYGPYQQWQMATSANKSTIYSNAITLAKATAIAVANSNSVAKASVQMVSSDVDVGYTDANGKYYSGNAGAIPANTFPNTVKVKARRDNTSLPQSNGEVGLFFGPVLGKNSFPLTASSTGVAYGGTITNITYNFKPGPGAGSGAGSSAGSSSNVVMSIPLPVAVDMTAWSDFYANGVNSPYADSNAASGTAWFRMYPDGTGSSMDGLLSFNGSKSSTTQFYTGGGQNGGWIQSGPSSTDAASMSAVGNLPLPANGTGNTWPAGPGMKSSLLNDFSDVITTPPTMRLMPLYDPNSSGTTSGGNGTYQICYLVPVYVVDAQGHGDNMDIAVVPASGNPLTDPTIVFSNVAPLGSSSVPAQFVVPVPAKLTQ